MFSILSAGCATIMSIAILIALVSMAWICTAYTPPFARCSISWTRSIPTPPAGWEMFGVRHGYAGLLEDDFVQLGCRDVSYIIQPGGTFLGSKRCEEFKIEAAQLRAVALLREREIDGLVVIDGDGSQAGSFALSQKGFPVANCRTESRLASFRLGGAGTCASGRASRV
jgi:hypothetical protein